MKKFGGVDTGREGPQGGARSRVIIRGGGAIKGRGTVLQESPETMDQRVSRSNTTEVRIRAAPEKVLVPSSAGVGQDWLQDGR